jgi:hypothetical protein
LIGEQGMMQSAMAAADRNAYRYFAVKVSDPDGEVI